MQLRPYQRDAVDAVLSYWGKGGGNPLVEMATGTGKSVVVANLVRELTEHDPETRVLMLVHVRELVAQNAQALLRAWPAAPLGINSAGLGRRDRGSQILFASIQSVAREDHNSIGRRHVILIDEAHLLPNSGDGQYRTLIDRLRDAEPELRVVGFTATPYRLGMGLLYGKGAPFDEVVYSYGIAEGVADGYLSPLVCRLGSSEIDVSAVKRQGGEFVAASLQEAARRPSQVVLSCKDAVEQLQDRKSWLVFCAGVEHAEETADQFRELGINAACVTGETPTHERDRILRAFKAGQIRALTNANVLTTGFDAPNVDAVVMMRPTLSTGLYCLDAETEILTSRGWKGMGQVMLGDAALAMDMETGKGVWSGVIAQIEHPMSAGESWVSYDAPRANFRVTDQHQMLISTKTRAGRTPWRKETAATAQGFKDGIYVPTAVHVDAPGVPLSDDELYLIGMIMTDGSITTHQVTIYQSERHPEIIERIESALGRAGIAYSKAMAAADSQFPERHARWRYSISAGDPRCGRPGKGIRYLFPFLDKELSPALFQLSKRQFAVLLSAMWDGDGSKIEKCPSVDWTPRGVTICTARRVVADRLQALAAMHGYTCNLRWEHGARKNPIAILTFNDQDWRSVGGSGPRPQIVMKPATDERVWCVQTEHGTIVTRRRGKVTVMGNCQMLGRGTRLAPGKTNCLVLDYAGNVRRHGPVDAIEVRGRKGTPGEAVEKTSVDSVRAKECPQCKALHGVAKLVCDDCGYTWPKAEKEIATRADREAVVMTRELEEVWHECTRGMIVARHDKAGGIPSLRVEYVVGFTGYREWITLDHPGLACARALQWWQGMTGLPMAAAAGERVAFALAVWASVQPKQVWVQVKRDGQYWRVTKRKVVRADGRLVEIDEAMRVRFASMERAA